MMDFELRRSSAPGAVPRALLLLALGAILFVGYWASTGTSGLSDARVKLHELERDLAAKNAGHVLLVPKPALGNVDDAWTAAKLLQTEWSERLMELERCSNAQVRLFRLSLAGPRQQPSMVVGAQSQEAIDGYLDCLNAGGSERPWVVTQIRVDASRVTGATGAANTMIGALEWRR